MVGAMSRCQTRKLRSMVYRHCRKYQEAYGHSDETLESVDEGDAKAFKYGQILKQFKRIVVAS